jgi:hypothetical protein
MSAVVCCRLSLMSADIAYRRCRWLLFAGVTGIFFFWSALRFRLLSLLMSVVVALVRYCR